MNNNGINEEKSKKIFVSLFENGIKNTTKSTEIDILDVFEKIRTCSLLKEQIMHLRNADAENKDKIKRNLSYITTSGTFTQRKENGLKQYSGLICIDLDNVPNLEKAKAKIIKSEFVFACFVSPSGAGLKVVFKVADNENLHKDTFNALKAKFELSNLQIDEKCKDLSRACFLSYDANIYINQHSITFLPTNTMTSTDKYNYIKKGVINTKNANFSKGERNDNVFKLANALNRYGVPKNEVEYLIITDFSVQDFPAQEITGTINSAYNNTQEYGKYEFKEPTTTKLVQQENAPAKKKEEKTTDKAPKNEQKRTPEVTLIENYLREKYDFRYNVLSNDIEIKLKNDSEYTILNENDLLIELLKVPYKVSERLLLAILKSSFCTPYNALREYFGALPSWTPQTQNNGLTCENDHITQLANYITTTDQPRFVKHFKKMLIRSIACSLGYGFNKHCFVLVGKQHDGKTSFIRFLCPDKLKTHITEYFNPEEKDSQIALCQNFIINLDELNSLERKEVNKIKSLMTLDMAKVRKPFDKKPESMPRIANFLGSTNDDNFLTDPTGSVRWLCFDIENINFDYSKNIDIDLVWAQAYTLFRQGEEYKLSKEDIKENEVSNEQYQKNTIEFDLLQEHFEEDKEREKNNFCNSTGVLLLLKAKTIGANLNFNANNVGKALKQLKYEKLTLSQRYGYFIKEK